MGQCGRTARFQGEACALRELEEPGEDTPDPALPPCPGSSPGSQGDLEPARWTETRREEGGASGLEGRAHIFHILKRM